MLSYHATRSPPGSGIQAQVASSSSVLASPHGQPSGYSGQGSRRNDLLEGFQERNEYTTRNSINAVTKKVTELADSMVVASALRDLAGGASSVTNTPALAVAAGAFYPLAQPFSPYQSSATMTERALRAHLFLSLSTPSLAHLHATRTMAAEYGSSMFDQSAAQQGMMVRRINVEQLLLLLIVDDNVVATRTRFRSNDLARRSQRLLIITISRLTSPRTQTIPRIISFSHLRKEQ